MGAKRSHRANLPGGRFRALALALACLFLTGRLASSLHLLVVRHNLCPDDGELVHPDQLHKSAWTPGLAAAGVPQSLQVGCDCEQSHGHDHCLSAAQRDERLLRVGAVHTTLSSLPPSLAPQALYVAHRSPKAFRVFRIAPKHSPPA